MHTRSNHSLGSAYGRRISPGRKLSRYLDTVFCRLWCAYACDLTGKFGQIKLEAAIVAVHHCSVAAHGKTLHAAPLACGVAYRTVAGVHQRPVVLTRVRRLSGCDSRRPTSDTCDQRVCRAAERRRHTTHRSANFVTICQSLSFEQHTAAGVALQTRTRTKA
jgi:hypothetical protein